MVYTYSPTFIRKAQLETRVLPREEFTRRFLCLLDGIESPHAVVRAGATALTRYVTFIGDEDALTGFRIELLTNHPHLSHCFTHQWPRSQVPGACEGHIIALYTTDTRLLDAIGVDDARPRRFYCRASKTLVLLNCDFYGRLKGAVRTLAGDLSDTSAECRFPWPVHAAAIETEFGGVCITGLAEVGKSTTYHALLRGSGHSGPGGRGRRFVSDDWTFIDVREPSCLSTGELRSHTKATTLLKFWPNVLTETSDYLMEFGSPASITSDSRLLLDLRRLWGEDGCVPRVSLRFLVILVREPSASPLVARFLEPDAAVNVLEAGGLSVSGSHPYFNNALLTDENAPIAGRRQQAAAVTAKVRTIVVNTVVSERVTVPLLEHMLAGSSGGAVEHGKRLISLPAHGEHDEECALRT